MVQPLPLRAALFVAATTTLAIGCSSGVHADDPDDPFTHRAYTAWHALPSSDGSQLALVLEPRRVDSVSGSGWQGQVAGAGLVKMVVGADAGRVVTSVPRGILRVDGNAKTLFVWTLDAAAWKPEAPNDPPPPARYATATWLDRATFAVQGTRTFDPPLEHPVALGGSTLLDSPRPSASTVARPVRLVAHDYLTGAEEVLHEARGFDVATCERASGVVIAYQPESAVRQTVIVDAERDPDTGRMHLAQVEIDELAPGEVVCRGSGARVAVVGTRAKSKALRSVVVRAEPGADALAIDFDADVGGMAALSEDGATLLAQRDDGSATLVTASGQQHIAAVVPRAPVTVSADRAWVSTDDGAYVVRLDGSTPTVVKVSNAKTGDVSAWATGRGAFLAFETTYDPAGYGDLTKRTFVLSDTGPVDIPVPAYENPFVAYADATRAYVVGDVGEKSDVVTIDLATRSVSGTVPFPLCDRAAMRARGECIPSW
jgi:hypothetical protein